MEITMEAGNQVGRVVTAERVDGFLAELNAKERSVNTIARYIHDVKAYRKFLDGREATAEETSGFKRLLIERGYKATSINTMLMSLTAFFNFMDWSECKTDRLIIQRDAYCPEEKELTRREYETMVKGADERDRLVVETICSTGIRVSELRAFTLEGVMARNVEVKCKRKIRRVMVPDELAEALAAYAEKQGIKSGPIFLSKRGNPLDRRRIWEIMKRLAAKLGILASKVFPHNLRKLFARTFIKSGGDMPKLADVLGHSSIETTRIYTKTSGAEHRRLVNSLGLVSIKTNKPSHKRKGGKRKKK